MSGPEKDIGHLSKEKKVDYLARLLLTGVYVDPTRFPTADEGDDWIELTIQKTERYDAQAFGQLLDHLSSRAFAMEDVSFSA